MSVLFPVTSTVMPLVGVKISHGLKLSWCFKTWHDYRGLGGNSMHERGKVISMWCRLFTVPSFLSLSLTGCHLDLLMRAKLRESIRCPWVGWWWVRYETPQAMDILSSPQFRLHQDIPLWWQANSPIDIYNLTEKIGDSEQPTYDRAAHGNIFIVGGDR